MPEAGVPPAMRNQPEEDRRPREDGSLENWVSKCLSSAYVIVCLRMPDAQAAPRDNVCIPDQIHTPCGSYGFISTCVLFLFRSAFPGPNASHLKSFASSCFTT